MCTCFCKQKNTSREQQHPLVVGVWLFPPSGFLRLPGGRRLHAVRLEPLKGFQAHAWACRVHQRHELVAHNQAPQPGQRGRAQVREGRFGGRRAEGARGRGGGQGRAGGGQGRAGGGQGGEGKEEDIRRIGGVGGKGGCGRGRSRRRGRARGKRT
eukprot:822062-Pyramimonas_sp.AAC.1